MKKTICLTSVFGLLVGLLLTWPIKQVSADESSGGALSTADYQVTLAKVVRDVSTRALTSIVTIEVIGVMQADGEVRQDAPTSGIILDDAGHVLTSSWVTAGGSASIIVISPDGKRFPAQVVASDEHRDLVLLKVDPGAADWQPIEMPTDQVDPRIGETMIALARYGESNAPLVSTGILSAVDRLDGIAIQTDARISPAFYGGPLLDLRGRLRGVVIPAVGEGGAEDPTAWYDSGIAFAIPSSIILQKIDRLRDGENIRSGVLGLVVAGTDPYADGTQLSAIRKRSPADKAGLQVGDQLRSVGGRPVRRRQEIKLALGRFDAGEDVILEYEREGELQSTTATMVESIPPLKAQWLGVIASDQVIGPASDQPEDRIIVDTVLDNSPADSGLLAGDQLEKFDGSPILNTAALQQRLWVAEPTAPIELQIRRDGKLKTVAITPTGLDGSLDRLQLDAVSSFNESERPAWEIETLQLPDISNQCVLWRPDPRAAKRDDLAIGDGTDPVALAVIVCSPSARDPAVVLQSWKQPAKDQNVAICVICSEADDQWRPNEIDAVAKLTAASIKRSGARDSAVSLIGEGAFVGGEKSNPADSMALAVSLSTENIFYGVAVSEQTEPPAIRLRKDGPPRLLRVLVPRATGDDLPFWAETLRRIGCPLQTVIDIDRDICLQWTRSLLTI